MLCDKRLISQISKVNLDPIDVSGLIGVTKMVEKTMISKMNKYNNFKKFT